MTSPLPQTFAQFEASLSEYIDRSTLHHFYAEALALYCAGCSLQQVALNLCELAQRSTH